MKGLHFLCIFTLISPLAAFAQTDKPDAFQFFDVENLLERQNGRVYQKFLDMPTLSTGLFLLPAGNTDRQTPHIEDEVYYVITGKPASK